MSAGRVPGTPPTNVPIGPEPPDPRALRGSISHLLSPDELRQRGKDAYERGDNENSVYWFQRLLCVDPTCNTVHSNLSAAYGAMGDWSKALVHAKASVTLQPNWIKAHYRMGLAHFKLGNLREAENALHCGLQLNYDSRQIHQLIRDVRGARALAAGEQARAARWREEDVERARARAEDMRAREAKAAAWAAQRVDGERKSAQRRREERDRVRSSARAGRERVECAAMEREREGRERAASGAQTAGASGGVGGVRGARPKTAPGGRRPGSPGEETPPPDDPYEVLGVEPGASNDAVRAAYRKALLRAHPDKGGRPGAFARVQAAHAVLLDPSRRAVHDEARAGLGAAGGEGGVRHHGQSVGAAAGATRAEAVAEQLRRWGLDRTGAAGERGDWQARRARALNSRVRGEDAARAGDHGVAVRCFTEALRLLAGAGLEPGGEGDAAPPGELVEVLERRARSHAALGAAEAAEADGDEAEALRRELGAASPPGGAVGAERGEGEESD